MSFIKNWLRSDIAELNAYQVNSAEGLIKLDAMESPFDMPDEVRQQLLNVYADAAINRYPDPEASLLKKHIKQTMNIPDELDLLLGNGSDELIQILSLACGERDVMLSFAPSFVMYQMVAKFTRLKHIGIKLTTDFAIDLPLTLSAIATHQPKLIFIDYPNNPTGNLFNRQHIVEIISNTEAMVVLDEAYYIYASDSFLADISHYPNLVVLRTLSKLGFAGLRLGCLIANKEVVTALNKLRMPYNISTLTQVSAAFLLQQDYFHKDAKTIISQRAFLLQTLAGIEAIKVFPSQANFILFRVEAADALFVFIKQNGVLIKNLTAVLPGCLRVTVGTSRENELFIDLIKRYYG